MTKPNSKNLSFLAIFLCLNFGALNQNANAGLFNISCPGWFSGVQNWLKSLRLRETLSNEAGEIQEVENITAQKQNANKITPDKWAKAKSYDDLAVLAQDEKDKAFLLELDNIQFYSGNPFLYSHNIEGISLVMKRGIKDFKRESFMSVQTANAWGNAYDVVKISVMHPDDTTSIFYAFRQATGPFQTMMGGADFRPLFQAYYISAGDGRSVAMMYMDGKLQPENSGEGEYALIQQVDDNFIGDSLRKRGIKSVANTFGNENRALSYSTLFPKNKSLLVSP